MSFYNTTFLAFLIIIPVIVLIAGARDRAREKAREKFAPVELLQKFAVLEPRQRSIIRYSLIALSCALLLVAFARPQGGELTQEEEVEGIDIVLAIDISRSMLARDLQPNRLSAIKDVVYDFVESSFGDRIGVIAFSGDATVVCPLTTDHGSVLGFIDRLSTNEPLRPGTAIGDAIQLSVNRFRESDTGRVIILLTDGENNKGMDTIDAANGAKDAGVKIYTVGIGTPSGAPLPEEEEFGLFGHERYRRDNSGEVITVGLDEQALRQVANITGGEYFPVSNQNELRTLYGRIEREGMTQFQTRRVVRKDELAPYFLFFACLLLILEALYAYTAPSEVRLVSG